MGPMILEGTWEEIARHGAELAGRRVRVTVLDEAQPSQGLDRALAGLIAEAERLSVELPPTPAPECEPADPGAEGIAAKFRRQGFRP